MLRREDGLTLIELLVVMIIIAVLVTFALAFHLAARDRAADATAKSNIRTAVGAIEAYRGDNPSYDGMTLAGLKTTYSPGIANIAIEWVSGNDYCVSSTIGDRSWWKHGPAGDITMTSC